MRTPGIAPENLATHARTVGVHAETRSSPRRRVCLAAAGDVHCREDSLSEMHVLLERLSAASDVVCLCGDLTDHGALAEARVLAEAMRDVDGAPVVAVLGNHDYEGGAPEEIERILAGAGITVLSGRSCVIDGIGFAGTKGFGGGFGPHRLEAWGEPSIKAFVHEAVREAERLDAALDGLRVPSKIALLHYAPVASTLQGEPAEIHPFLGSSRLEEPLNRHCCTAALHGHAHRCAPSGCSSQGVPVYNVSLPVVRKGVDPNAFFQLSLEVEPEPSPKQTGGEGA